MQRTWTTGSGGQTTALLLLTGAGLMAVGSTVGVADNPPGIGLLYLGTVALVTAVAHRWRSPRSFLRLLYGAGIGFVVLVVVHNLAYAAASVTELAWLRGLWTGLGVTAFLVGVVACPAGLVVGAVGALLAWVLQR